MHGKAPNEPYPEQRSTGKLAPQRPPSTTMNSIHSYSSLTICSRFNALSALYFLSTSMHLLSTYLEGSLSTRIQSVRSNIEKTVYVALHKTRRSQRMDFPPPSVPSVFAICDMIRESIHPISYHTVHNGIEIWDMPPMQYNRGRL
jgi:hypothetical protein